MRFDDVQQLNGRWLALSDGFREFGYVQFSVVEEAPGIKWEPGGLLGRFSGTRSTLVVEETHWSVSEDGRRVLHRDGWDEVDDLNVMDPDLRSGSVKIGGVSLRWLSENEVAALLTHG